MVEPSEAVLPRLYRHSLALLTDLYELTMAYAFWKSGQSEREAVFHLTFREPPFGGAYAIACGLHQAVEFLRQFRFEAEDLEYLGKLAGGDGKALFSPDFLEYLGSMHWRCDVDAVPEGTVVFPREPLIRVRGPIIQSQIIETALLTIVNFQTLIATKSTRVCQAAGGQPVLEFGLRRAQGIDGGVSASRAAHIGGCAATSNVLAGKLYDIPVRGTHAHSWVMAFDNELRAFQAYAEALPNNCVFLVDTYDTLAGVRHAIDVARELRRRGSEPLGVRLDSGDLNTLSRETRKLLDQAGFPDAKIVASNDLDEYRIEQLRRDGAAIDVWGVGTRLVTAHDQPALGGVYKLSGLRRADGVWRNVLKLSEQDIKISDPGVLQIRRFHDADHFWGDALYDETLGANDERQLIDVVDRRPVSPPSAASYEDLLQPVLRKGELVQALPTTSAIRDNCRSQLARLPEAFKRFKSPATYRVAWDQNLYDLRDRLIQEAQENRRRNNR